MTLTDYVRRIALRWRVIVVTTGALVALATVLTFLMTPKYESTARLFVSSSAQGQDISTALGQGIYAQQKVLSYAAIASSDKMAESVIQDLNLSASPSEIAGEVKTTVEYGTVLIQVTVTDPSASRAHDITNSIITNYNRLINTIDVADGAKSPVNVTTMEPASQPTSPVSPKIGLNILASLFAGVLLGIGLAALRDLLDDTVKSVTDLEGADLPALGSTPNRAKKRGKRGPDHKALISSGEQTPAAEAFRQLRVNLQFASLDRQPRIVLVTSSGPGEGKSFVSANLAAVYADIGMHVTLVDLDLRRPVLAERLGLVKTVGVTSVLLGQVVLEEATQVIEGTNIHLLASGRLPPNPADVLSTQTLADLLDKLAAESDIVILDTPPAGLFADARQLAAHVDGCIVVSRHKRTKLGVLDGTVQGLREVGGNVLGVVINRSPVTSRSQYDQYGYSTYKAAPAKRLTKHAKS